MLLEDRVGVVKGQGSGLETIRTAEFWTSWSLWKDL